MRALARRAGLSRRSVRCWRERFAQEGVAGSLRDKTRRPGTPPLPAATVGRVVELTLGEPPGEATHWTGRMMAAFPAFRIAQRRRAGFRDTARYEAYLAALRRAGLPDRALPDDHLLLRSERGG